MLINFYCFTSYVYYFWLEIYDKTIIGFSLWFSPLEMYNIIYCLSDVLSLHLQEDGTVLSQHHGWMAGLLLGRVEKVCL